MALRLVRLAATASITLRAGLCLIPVQNATAQRSGGRDSAFSDLRRDGNGIAALQTTISDGFTNVSAADALRAVATTARLNLTFDAGLPELRAMTSVAPHARTAAVALIEIATVARVRVRVSTSGQLIVLGESHATTKTVAASDSVQREPVSLPAIRTEAVRAERKTFETETNVGDVVITGRELHASPTFVEPDLLRSIQLLPGVETRSDWAAGFNVRGGEADQSLILIDGYPIYNPFHLGGLFSTFIDATVGTVELHKGALAPRYGGRLSGVLDVHSAEPTSLDKHGTVEVSLASSSASIGEQFAGGEGSWMVAARRTYADAAVSLLVHPGAFPYHFRDVQGHVTRRFGDTQLSITGYDGLDLTVGSGDQGRGSWGNSVLGLTLSHRVAERPHLWGFSLGDSATAEQRVSLTRFGAYVDITENLFHARNTVSEARAAGSGTAYSGRLSRTLGYEVATQRVEYNARTAFNGFGDFLALDSLGQRSRWAALYGEQLWHATPSLLLDLGLRLETVPSARWSGLSPRVSAKYFLGRNVAVSLGAGTYSQWMHSLGREEEPIQPLQFWLASDSVTPVSRAHDATLGLDRWVTSRRLFHVEAFYKRYDHLLVPNVFNDSRTLGDEFKTTTGTSYGVDVLLRQLDGGRFSGWLAYSYALNTRVGPDSAGYFPSQDRRHNLNLVGSWRAGAYTLGARANLASGLPTTPVVGEFARSRYDPRTHTWVPTSSSEAKQNITGPYNSERLPWYTRVDVSAKRTGKMFGAQVEPYLSIVNLLNAHNPAAYLYTFDGRGKRASFPNLPFAPTFGVSVAY